MNQVQYEVKAFRNRDGVEVENFRKTFDSFSSMSNYCDEAEKMHPWDIYLEVEGTMVEAKPVKRVSPPVKNKVTKSKIEWNGVQYYPLQVADGYGCEGCAFQLTFGKGACKEARCTPIGREDRRNVIWLKKGQ